MLGASVGSSLAVVRNTTTQAARAAEQAAKDAGQTAEQIMRAGQKAVDDSLKALTSMFGLGAVGAAGYAGFGDAGVVSGPVAALLTSFGLEAGAAGAIGVAAETGILTAPMWLPLVMDLVSGVVPKPPTPSQKKEAAAQGPAKLKQAEDKTGKSLVDTGPLDNIAASVGVSPPILIGGGVGFIALLLLASRK
jgi:hypothetical protein